MRLSTIFVPLLSVVLMSYAQGADWVAQTGGGTHWLRGADFVSSTTGWAVGESGSILKSTTGGTSWTSQTSGVTNDLHAVDFIDASTGWAVGDGTGIILKTTNGGTTWTPQDAGNSLESVQFISSSVGWASGLNGVILKTTNGGTTWGAQSSGVVSCIESIFFINATTGWCAGQFPGSLLKTTDGGTSWVPQTNGIDPNDDIISVFFIDAQTGWLVGHGDPGGVSTGLIEKTTNGGATWTTQTSGTDQYLLSVAFVNATTGWTVGSGGTILKTTNGGTTWASEPSGTTFELDRVVLRLGEGGWITGDNGSILRNTIAPLPVQLASLNATVVGGSNVLLNWMTVSEVNNYGFVFQRRSDDTSPFEDIPGSFTPGYGTTLEPQHYSYTQLNVIPGHYDYRLKQIDLDGLIHYSFSIGVDVTVVTSVSEETPRVFDVSQNYPNPFNPTTSIHYQLPVHSNVTLTIYNMLGQEVKTLVNGEQSAGYKSVEWDSHDSNGNTLPSGAYIYRVQASSLTNGFEFTDTKKMLLLK
jgi:photosystem II stability/assembly factor-like uncharacterized protein